MWRWSAAASSHDFGRCQAQRVAFRGDATKAGGALKGMQDAFDTIWISF